MEKRNVAATPVMAGAAVAGVPRVTPAPKLFTGPAKIPFVDPKKQSSMGRGAPPPVPPNKPVVPPKKDTILSRRAEVPHLSEDSKSSPQTLKYGMSNKDKKPVDSGGGPSEQVQVGESAALHEVTAQIEDLEYNIDQMILNTSS